MLRSPTPINATGPSRIPIKTGLKVAAILIIVNVVALATHIYFQTVLWYSSETTSGLTINVLSTLWLVIPISAAWALHQTMRYERRLLAAIVVSFASWTMTFVWSFFAVMASWNPERDEEMQYAVSLICETYCPGDTWERYVQKQREMLRMFERMQPEPQELPKHDTI